MNTQEPTEAQRIQREHFKYETGRLKEYEDNLEAVQRFVASNKDKLCDLNWHACHIYGRIEITIGNAEVEYYEQDARTIARRWPGRVWIRTKNNSVCGVIDWVSKPAEPGSVPIVIQSAEVIKWSPEPNTEVQT